MAKRQGTYLSNENVLKNCIFNTIIPSKEIIQPLNINGKPNVYKTFSKSVSAVNTAVNMSNYNMTPEQAYNLVVNNKVIQKNIPNPINEASSAMVDTMFSNVIKNAPDDVKPPPPPPTPPTGRTKAGKERAMRNSLKSITGAKTADMRSIKKALRDKFGLGNTEITDYLNSLMEGDLQDLPMTIEEIENSLLGSSKDDPPEPLEPLDPEDDPEDAP